MTLWGLWESASRYARTHRARVLFLSVAGVGAVAGTVFVHGQYRRVSAFLDAQRAEGARALRAQFVGNGQAVRDGLRALLPLLRDALARAPGADADALVAALRGAAAATAAAAPDRERKRAMWERLKAATLAELAAAAYLLAALHAALALQVNLLARYARAADADAAAAAALPAPPPGAPPPAARSAFLRAVREHLLAPRLAGAVLGALAADAGAEVADVPLKRRVVRADVACVVGRVCAAFRARALHELSGDWLFAVDGAEDMDDDFRALIDEALDLAFELDITKVIHDQAEFLVHAALDSVPPETWGGEEGIPFAQLLAPLQKAGRALLETVPEGLQAERSMQQFAAAVLISGELGSRDPLRAFSGR